MKQSDEVQAIARLKRGDIGGLETLVRQHQLDALDAAYLITRDRPLAEDIVQNAFIRVYERIHQFDSARPFAPWFFRMVVNDATKAVTRGIRPISLNHEGNNAETVLADLIADSGANPEQALEAAELQQIIEEALDELTPEQRASIVLYYYLDESVGDIADVLETKQGTIKWRLHAARQQLRRLLSPFFVAVPGAQENQS